MTEPIVSRERPTPHSLTSDLPTSESNDVQGYFLPLLYGVAAIVGTVGGFVGMSAAIAPTGTLKGPIHRQGE